MLSMSGCQRAEWPELDHCPVDTLRKVMISLSSINNINNSKAKSCQINKKYLVLSKHNDNFHTQQIFLLQVCISAKEVNNNLRQITLLCLANTVNWNRQNNILMIKHKTQYLKSNGRVCSNLSYLVSNQNKKIIGSGVIY